MYLEPLYVLMSDLLVCHPLGITITVMSTVVGGAAVLTIIVGTGMCLVYITKLICVICHYDCVDCYM